jgi:YD repeat-containing protein
MTAKVDWKPPSAWALTWRRKLAGVQRQCKQVFSAGQKTGGTDHVTRIEHDSRGNLTTIISPFGQRTTLSVDANGFLASFANPAGEQTQLTSSSGGLLGTLTNPRGKTSTFTFDADGHLIADADATGGVQTLVRNPSTNGFIAGHTTALSRTTTYQTENLAGEVQRRTTTTAPDGTQYQSIETPSAGTTHASSPDGTTSNLTLSPDPRFGMASPVLASLSIRLASGIAANLATSRSVVLSNSANPLSLVSLIQSNTINGRTAGGRGVSKSCQARHRGKVRKGLLTANQKTGLVLAGSATLGPFFC